LDSGMSTFAIQLPELLPCKFLSSCLQEGNGLVTVGQAKLALVATSQYASGNGF